MTRWHLIVVLDFLLASAVAFAAGFIAGRRRGHAAGFRAGLSWGGRLTGHFREQERIAGESKR